MDRPRPDPDRMTVGALHTIATRTWKPPTGQARDERLAELRTEAGDRMDLLIEAAGILLGARPDDEHDPRHIQRTAGAEMLLELAGVRAAAPEVQRWVPVGAERRARWRQPEPPRGVA